MEENGKFWKNSNSKIRLQITWVLQKRGEGSCVEDFRTFCSVQFLVELLVCKRPAFAKPFPDICNKVIQ